MRLILSILILMTLSFACKTTKVEQEQAVIVDTIEFNYLYSEALKYNLHGNEEKAIDLFLQCLNLKKESTASAYQLSKICLKQKNYPDAVRYADFCLEKMPDNEWYMVHRAEIARENNERAKYVNIYRKLVNLFPDNLNYVYELAIICYQEKQYDEAFHFLDDIEKITGVNENLSFLRNNINFELKHFDAIQAELLKLKVFFPDSVKYMDMLAEFYVNFNMQENALNLYKNILSIDSVNVNAFYGLAFVYGKLKVFNYGFPYLEKAIISSEIEAERKEKCAELYLNAPENTLNDNQIDFIYLNLLNNASFNIEIINEYISHLYKLKKLTQTERIAKISIKNRPGNYMAWEYLFNIFIAQSRFEELNTYSIKALEYFPAHSSVYFFAGYSFFIQHKYPEAIGYLESGKTYIVDNKDLEQQFNLYLAESYHSVGKHKKSDEYFESYLKNDSTNAYLLNNYAYYLAKRDIEIEKAERLSLKSIEIEPFNSTFLDTYSWILYLKNDFKNALNYIQRSYRYGGNKNAVIIEHYGDILLKLGNVEEAIKKWEESLSINPQNERLIEKMKELKK